MAVDKDTNLNYHFSLPNKLFDYIHAGIPVLASDLPELKKIINRYDIGYFLQNHDPKNIAATIEYIFENAERYKTVKSNTEKAREKLCWENEEKNLLQIIQQYSSKNLHC